MTVKEEHLERQKRHFYIPSGITVRIEHTTILAGDKSIYFKTEKNTGTKSVLCRERKVEQSLVNQYVCMTMIISFSRCVDVKYIPRWMRSVAVHEKLSLTLSLSLCDWAGLLIDVPLSVLPPN